MNIGVPIDLSKTQFAINFSSEVEWILGCFYSKFEFELKKGRAEMLLAGSLHSSGTVFRMYINIDREFSFHILSLARAESY